MTTDDHLYRRDRISTSTEDADGTAVPGRVARSARRLVLHLPTEWPWEQAWADLAANACGPPPATP